MNEEILQDNNCIVKAFENNPISILKEDNGDKKVYYFKASDIEKALNLTNIRVSIQSYDEDERVVRKAYDTTNREQDTIFLSSQGVYRLLYNSKKDQAKKFRKWAGAILDDIIFNESQELQKKLQETQKLLEKERKEKALMQNRRWVDVKPCESVYVYRDNLKDNNSQIKIGKSKDLSQREREYSGLNKSGAIVYYKKVLNCSLTERVCHHILDKYRINRNQEWFNISEDLAKETVNMVSSFLDKSIDNLNEFIELHKKIQIHETENKENENEICQNKNAVNKVIPLTDFQEFFNENCTIGEQHYCFKDDLRMAFRIIFKSTDKEKTDNFINFVNNKFSSGVEYSDTMRKNVFRGFSLNELKWHVDENINIKNYEYFISSECEVGWKNRVSYADFFHNYTKWMEKKEPDFKLTMKLRREIQMYLERKFAGGRVYISDISKSTHLHGIWGLSLKGQGFLKPKKLTRKTIAKCSTNDDSILQTWDSLCLASDDTLIPKSTLSSNIRFKKHFEDGYYYKFL